jgi:hypothetical protein
LPRRYEEADLILAARKVERAINDEGISPPYHQEQLANLRQHWPVLYNSVIELAKIVYSWEHQR